jgi:hypothetical protein
MSTRQTASLLAVIFLITSVCNATDELIIPDGIKYKKTSDEANQLAKAKLTKLFNAEAKREDILSLFENKVLICGPALWLDIKDDKSMSSIKKGNVEFHMPVVNDKQEISRMVKAHGKLFQSPDEVCSFWKAFVSRTNFSNLTIRKLNPLELKIYWSMIPYDITEPLFILESEKHKILTVFTSSNNPQIAWIDDYQNVCFKKENE